MKKYISVILILLCMMLPVGCRTDMNYITENKPHITGVVKEISDDSLLIENESGVYSVSLEAEYSDSMTHFSIGDEVKVYCTMTAILQNRIQCR